MARGLDFSFARPSPESVKSGGYDFICRYLSAVPGKNISADEASHAFSAGLSIALVWESTAARALDGFAAGSEDAQNALQVAQQANCGNIPAIYFAVDFDASEADQVKIDDYLKGAASVLGLPRVGVYGGYWVVKRCFDNGTVSWGWQTYAWSGKNWDDRAHLRQIQNGVKFNGMDVDIDETINDNYGQLPLISNQTTVTPETDFQNCWITQATRFATDEEVQAWKDAGTPLVYQYVQQHAPNPALDELRVQLAQAITSMNDATNHINTLNTELTAANARITELESQINIQPAPTPAPVPFPNLEELLKAIWNLITKK